MSESSPVSKVAQLPIDKSGRLYHLGLLKEELNSRILTVGDPSRAFIISKLLDGADASAKTPEQLGSKVFYLASNRGFVTFSGLYHNVPVSIIAIGMGFPMMDFLVRESRAIINGNMAIIRFGTCGSLDTKVKVGSVLITDSACLVIRNVGAFIERRDSIDSMSEDHWDKYYNVSPCEYPSAILTEILENVLKSHHQEYSKAKNATCDSFYSSQGRSSIGFMDVNEKLLPHLQGSPHNIQTMDMETFYLFHLANLIQDKDSGDIHTADIKFAIANRITDEFLMDDEIKINLESTIGKYCLEALSKFPL